MTRWRSSSKLRGFGATLGAFAIVTAGAMASARPASAQDIERVLAGIRLNTKSSNVLAKYGNPNQVVIGDVGIRGTGPNGATGGGASGGFGGAPGGAPGDSGGLPGLGGGGEGGGRTIGGGGKGQMAGPSGGGFGGPPPGEFGQRGGGSFGGTAGPSGEGDVGGGFPGSGAPGGGNGGASGAVGPFGQSISTLAREQEVTWIYNRKVNNNLVSYNFLIGPNGNVVQITVSGYSGGNSKTKRGIGLGSTYKDVVRAYGYPEDHAIVGRTLIASYRTKAHVSFQFLPETPQSNPMATGNKVIAIIIATVE